MLSVLLAGCDTLQSDEEPSTVRPLTEAEQHIVQADNSFGLSLFDAINASTPEENVFISPLSVSMALGMTLNGAAGDTREEMVSVLEKQNLTEEAINQSYQSLIRLLSGLDESVLLNIANSIWYRQGFDVEPDFLDKNRTFFEAEIEALDFTAPESVDIINNWVDDKTNGLIDSIIQEISSEAIMYLMNAIYFKGIWTYQFDPELTEEASFNNLSGSISSIPMMAQRSIFRYYKSDNAAFLDVPYGDSLYTMTVVLPDDPADINTLISDLNDGLISSIEPQLAHTEVDLFMPRFTLAYDTKMRDVLQLMGMEKAFLSSAADFSRIHPTTNLYISEVLHKSFIEVNEEGTEAAAVTAVIIETTSIGPSTPVFNMNRPFIFLIREKSSGTYLFAGKIAEL